ncbi:MAG: L,D-transpeptidase family protein [Epsilonproteobacteria bacterium]|nr:L,D-transpeptidase family protein [Campylobacterota bacterium]
MKINKLLLLTLLSSIFLYSEPIKKENPFDSLIIDEENNNSTFQKLQSDLKAKLTSKFTSNKIHHKKFLKRFYRQNSYSPLWFNNKSLDNKKITSLFEEIQNDLTLNPKSKIYKKYKYISQYINNKKRKNIYLELQLTELYFDFLNHILYGSIEWKKFSWKLKQLRNRGISAQWVRYKPKYSISELLLQPNIHETIKEITPKRFGYYGLLKSLKKLKDIKVKGGWKKLPYFKKLKLGDKGVNVIKLRERLEASGDLTSCLVKSDELFETEEKDSIVKFQPRAKFDLCLEDAVKKFQSRHGLKSDGVVGPTTRAILNISVESKIKTVILNLDRIKWLPREKEDRYLIVNIPEYMLHYIENGKEKDKIKVIVGDRRHHTPIFREKISFIVLNPYWKVPEGIVKKEVIPNMIKNPNYLKREGLEIRRTWSEKSSRINPYEIFWEDYYYTGEKFPYRIMQPPGPRNALGKIKFKFPNKFNVYLHDTPTKRLFKKTKRAFSHGCIRLSQPQKLLEIIASFNDNIDLKKSKKILKGKNKVQINIDNKITVYLIYLTAGYNKNGRPEFRDDIYGYDKMQKIDK